MEETAEVRSCQWTWCDRALRVFPATVRGGMQKERTRDSPGPRKYRVEEKWWARQDSNLGPRDSLYPFVSEWSGLSHHPRPNR